MVENDYASGNIGVIKVQMFERHNGNDPNEQNYTYFPQ